jgi:hypothetical protein
MTLGGYDFAGLVIVSFAVLGSRLIESELMAGEAEEEEGSCFELWELLRFGCTRSDMTCLGER